MKVCKFGGSSLSCGANFRKVKNIVESDPERRVVVVSAPGKRMSGDNKVTDLLYICRAHIRYHVEHKSIWDNIAERYREIVRECGLSDNIEQYLAEVEESLTEDATEDDIVSRGEYLNARLMAEYLGYDFVDAKDWLFFDFDGKVDFERTYDALRDLAQIHERMVIPGFYGALPDGSIHTFSRGGSDVTGALASAALLAECYENWTDVSGILMADPKLVNNPRPIRRVTFNELRELSYMGAEVLHEETVFPVRQANIPLYIKNTNDPTAEGTLIMEAFEGETADEKNHFVTGITGRQHFTIITLEKSGLQERVGYLRQVVTVVEHFKVPIEHVPSSIDRVSLVIPSRYLEHCQHELLKELHDVCAPDAIKVQDQISLIAVVGRRMASAVGVSGKLFSALGNNGINIRLILQGADEINIMVGVMDRDFTKAIETLYNSFT